MVCSSTSTISYFSGAVWIGEELGEAGGGGGGGGGRGREREGWEEGGKGERERGWEEGGKEERERGVGGGGGDGEVTEGRKTKWEGDI